MKYTTPIMAILGLGLVLAAPTVRADDNELVLKELKSLGRKVDRVLEAVENQGEKEKSIVRAGVDMKCLRSAISNYKGNFFDSTLVQFATGCKSTIDEQACKKVGKSINGDCAELLLATFKGNKFDSTIQQFNDACSETIYKCE